MSRWYKLVGKDHEVVPCNLHEGARMLDKERVVNQTTLPNEILISTVFLGLDHRYSGTGPPIVFETMVFGGPNDGLQERCCTWREAKAMHRRVVNMHVGRLKVVKRDRNTGSD